MRWIAVAAASSALLAGCTHSGIEGTPTADTASAPFGAPSPSTITSTVSTTTSNSGPVKGTTFDACTAITDADTATWDVKPDKRDAHTTAFGQNVRGCIWDGPKWGIKIYAVDTTISQLEQPNSRFDRQERVQVGSRTGWLLHDKNWIGCSVAIPSQQAIATVQVDLNLDLTRERYDQCPLALRIMTQIEPKIP
ncbi:DUF3558 family protein [Mycobacteroides salmoniphilum]|uniref:DUF3558 domain-containing protein n=1 Tax=Mycobacteroides salmoniphilum TaxID=404941 RepID=A0A4R8SKB1_9MYCO|nr:DUF3558 family protein [Mycobacteroides salmoniphilum]TDZ97632.1 hypothetical protein CCUG60885_01181 [Mycobacteroides salmoniphilum]TEA01862.1 hypothetical protein CCUG60883_04401 [Mycobacteroides salmoniphilum]